MKSLQVSINWYVLKKGECRQLTVEEEKKLKDSIGRS